MSTNQLEEATAIGRTYRLLTLENSDLDARIPPRITAAVRDIRRKEARGQSTQAERFALGIEIAEARKAVVKAKGARARGNRA